MYRHTQTGWLIIISLLASIAAGIVLEFFFPQRILISVLAVLVVLLFLFPTLTVSVDDDLIHVRFGIGLIFRKIPLAEVASARPIRTKWYYGWGVRFLGDGWMFNISGFDAVEVTLKNGKKFTIGTDDPAGLNLAVRQRLN